MKKILILFVLVFSIQFSFAQFKGFTLGPKVGVNFSKLNADISGVSGLKEEMRPGFEVGAFVRLFEKIYLQPEVLWVVKGGTLKNDLFEQKIRLKTLDIPVLVGWRIINLKVVNLRIMAGPVASVLLDSEVKIEGNTVSGEDYDFNSTNWAAQAGIGVDILMFAIDVRYEFGLNDISKQGDSDLKNNLINVSLGWKIF